MDDPMMKTKELSCQIVAFTRKSLQGEPHGSEMAVAALVRSLAVSAAAMTVKTKESPEEYIAELKMAALTALRTVALTYDHLGNKVETAPDPSALN